MQILLYSVPTEWPFWLKHQSPWRAESPAEPVAWVGWSAGGGWCSKLGGGGWRRPASTSGLSGGERTWHCLLLRGRIWPLPAYAEKSTEELNKRMTNDTTSYMYINVQLLRVAMNMISAHMTVQVHINGKHLLSGCQNYTKWLALMHTTCIMHIYA